MDGKTAPQSWFTNYWRSSRKSTSEPEKAVLGILAFEVACLMTKVAKLWLCLRDGQIARLREEIANSIGIRKLISEDDDYLMDLAFAELIENFGYVAKSVARLGKKCTDPVYHDLEHVFDNPVEINLCWSGWEYKLKKMERKVKKMERFVAFLSQLNQEIEVLAELQQSLKTMQSNSDISRVKLLEFKQKVLWQRQEVKNLRDMTPWVRTYDYTVRLLLRSLFTIVRRIKVVFGANQLASIEENSYSKLVTTDSLAHGYSVSARMNSSVHPSENDPRWVHSALIGRSVSNLGLGANKIRSLKKHYQSQYFSLPRKPSLKAKGLGHSRPFKECMTGGSKSPVLQSFKQTCGGTFASTDRTDKTKDHERKSSSCCTKVSIFVSKRKLLNAPPSTVGGVALALHYANVIILIEKLASFPHLISLDARDDLYNMLPTNIKNSLRGKLKLFSKTLASSAYDATLASEWKFALARILEWLAPLAHCTKRWHSERNFEKQHMSPGTNVLLLHTLHFANLVKTEAAIVELLIGLNYISRFERETDQRASMESAPRRPSNDFIVQMDSIIYGM